MSMVLAVVALSWGIDQRAAQALIVDSDPTSPGFGYYIPDYFTTPNWANSPPLRKFVDRLPGLTAAGVNNLGQYIPVAIPNTTAFPGSDYYEIEVGEYSKQMHSDLPPTKLRGYRQTNTTDATVSQFQYLGPLIIAQKDRPVRIKFTNSLPFGLPDPVTGRRPGDLFVPVDTTIMGSGPFEVNYDPVNKTYPAGPPFPAPDPAIGQIGMFTQNRATLHLHGGRTPWISDGTPHQWITPAAETTYYSRGVSLQNVPDMPDPGNGSQTFYYSNQQSARLMFYHDHAWGITRLNVYVGEAAGYLMTDQFESALLGLPGGAPGIAPVLQSVGYGTPLVIQDKTFVDGNPASPTYVLNTDPTWAWGSNPQQPVTTTPVTGDLWWPHVYMPAQNPFNPDQSGLNPFGRYHYGPWFFPPTPVCGSSPEAVPPLCISFGPVPNPYCLPTPPADCNPDPVPPFDCSASLTVQPPCMPGTHNPSTGAEAFMDTMLVNGTAYPYVEVQPQQYRFRILNAAHDRFLNLQLYQADTAVSPGCSTCAPNTEVRMIPAEPPQEGIFNNDWTLVPGLTPSGPALAWNPVANNLQMVVRGEGNSIWTGTFNSSGTFNNVWTQITGATIDSPALAWNPVALEMQMVVRGGGDTIWTATFNSSGTFNNDWTQISGTTPDYPALAWDPNYPGGGRMQLVVRGGGNSIWTATFNSTGAFNNDWTQVPGATPSAPALAWNEGTQKMQMAVRGMNDLIWTSTFDGITGTFNNDWTPISLIFGGTTTSGPALVQGETMHLVVTMAGNSIWTGTFNPATGVFNYDWKQIPGAVLDVPALAWNVVANMTQMVARGGGDSIWTATGGPSAPANWPTDGREGGVPDFAMRGPAFIQIGTEGGFLPGPVVLPNQPVRWNADVTMFNFGNVLQQNEGGGTLFLGPAERADVIVDFTNFAGKTLILYNDAPTALPALVPQYDYYTGAPDRRDIGGANTTPVGRGPNIRTVMQIRVGTGGTPRPCVNPGCADDFNTTTLTALQTAFNSATGAPGVFAQGQAPIIVGQTAYNLAYNHTFPATFPNWGISRITDDAISYETVNPDLTFTLVPNFPMQRKAMHDEMGATFDDYGRMSAKLGLEVQFANAATQNFILQNYVDPPTETIPSGGIQLWRVTHNGVDTHPIHFHLFEVQLINRVGWDGFIRLPDPNEIGWKDTVRISPLEDTIVALRATIPTVPFVAPLPISSRPLNPSTPLGSEMGFSQINTTDGGPLVPPMFNQVWNFGYEYVWHCHILSHEENDMMRSVVITPIP